MLIVGILHLIGQKLGRSIIHKTSSMIRFNYCSRIKGNRTVLAAVKVKSWYRFSQKAADQDPHSFSTPLLNTWNAEFLHPLNWIKIGEECST